MTSFVDSHPLLGTVTVTTTNSIIYDYFESNNMDYRGKYIKMDVKYMDDKFIDVFFIQRRNMSFWMKTVRDNFENVEQNAIWMVFIWDYVMFKLGKIRDNNQRKQKQWRYFDILRYFHVFA